MRQIVFDTLKYVVDYDNDVLVEGYDGFRIEESYGGKQNFVVYKKMNGDYEQTRRFVLPDTNESLGEFFKLKDNYDDYFKEHDLLMAMTKEVLESYDGETELKDICDNYYEMPDNYIFFVVLNVTKTQFFYFVKERAKLC